MQPFKNMFLVEVLTGIFTYGNFIVNLIVIIVIYDLYHLITEVLRAPLTTSSDLVCV